MSKNRDQPDSQRGPVLMQRMIALNGVLDIPKSAQVLPDSTPPIRKPPIDLSATVLEWGAQRVEAEPAKPELVAAAQPSSETKAQSDPGDAEWATYSSIAMQPFDDLLLSQQILGSNIEDATTRQYNPAPRAQALADEPTTTDLASLDRALESAGALQDDAFGLQLPAWPAPRATVPQPAKSQRSLLAVVVAWTVLGVVVLCALALAYLFARLR